MIVTTMTLQHLDTVEGRISSFGHVFAQGDIPDGQSLVAMSGSTEIPVQIDVLATWPDGSAKHAIISLQNPATISGTAEITLSTSAVIPTPALDLAATALAQDYDFTVTIDNEVVDVAALVQAGPVDMWQSGPLVAQGRVTQTLANGLEVRVDITARADGTIETSVIVGNDNIQTTTLDALTYAVEIAQNGEAVYSNDALTQHHFTVWREKFTTEDALNTAHPVYDFDYMRSTGLLPSVDTAIPLTDSTIYGDYLDQDGATYDPTQLGGIDNQGGIDPDRGRTGPTPSYGLVTDDQHSYLVTQDAGARRGMLELTDQYGAFSDFYRNPETDGAYFLEDTDFNSSRTGIGKDLPGTGGVIDLTNDGDTNRNKPSHNPSSFYTSYLVTGDRYYADGLTSEAASPYLLWANAAYLTERGAVDFNAQLREQSWVLRDLFQAASLAPDGTHAAEVLNTRLEGALQDYYDYYIGGETLTNQAGRAFTGSREAARFTDGELRGVLQSYNGTAIDRPYWQDWFGMVIGQIAATGNETARALGEWMAGFSAGRFLQDDFDPYHYLYSISGSPSGSRAYDDDIGWADLQQHADDAGTTGTDDWSSGSDFYAPAAWGGTASLLSGTRDARYAEALLWMAEAISDDVVAATVHSGTSAQFAVPVTFLDHTTVGITERTNGTALNDMILDGDGSRIINGGDGNDRIETGAGNHLVAGGDGNDTLIAGDGEDWLFGGSGADIIFGGAGVNYLQGDRHDVDFGRFADTFRFEGTLGQTVIGDFDADQDTIELHAFAGVQDFYTAVALFVDTEAGALLDLGQEGSLTLTGVTVADLPSRPVPPDPVIPESPTIFDTPSSIITGSGWLRGTAADDYITPTSQNVRVFGGDGNDRIDLTGYSQSANGGDGDDVFWLHSHRHTIRTGDGADSVVIAGPVVGATIRDFDITEDTLYFADGVGGIDTVDDILDAAAENSRGVIVNTDAGRVMLRGLTLDDLQAADLRVVSTVADDDRLDVLPQIETGPLITGSGWLNGTDGSDLIASGGGNIRLSGGASDDHLILDHWGVRALGGAGDDLLESRAHNAILSGGEGADIFHFTARVDGKIVDFDPGRDRIAIDSSIYDDLTIPEILQGISQGPNGAVLAGTNGDTLIFETIDAARLSADDFFLV